MSKLSLLINYFIACQGGCAEIVEYMLSNEEFNTDVNIRDSGTYYFLIFKSI